MENTSISYRKNGEVCIFEVEGDLDIFCANHLSVASKERIEKGEIHFLIDFKRISFLDSTGISALLGVFKNARAKKGSLGLFNLSNECTYILETSGVSKVVKIYPSQLTENEIVSQVRSSEMVTKKSINLIEKEITEGFFQTLLEDNKRAIEIVQKEINKLKENAQTPHFESDLRNKELVLRSLKNAREAFHIAHKRMEGVSGKEIQHIPI